MTSAALMIIKQDLQHIWQLGNSLKLSRLSDSSEIHWSYLDYLTSSSSRFTNDIMQCWRIFMIVIDTLTLTVLTLLSLKAQWRKDLWKPSKPSHPGIHWIALTECSHMSTHLPRFQSFYRFLYHFVLAKLASSSIRVKYTGTIERYRSSLREPDVSLFRLKLDIQHGLHI